MNRTKKAWWRDPSNLALAVFLAVGGYFLWIEHEAHIIAALPWLLIGACLVMHLFMHRGHGHGSSKHQDDSADQGNKGS